jgi:ubiquitin C-terminal hydrolase
VGKVSEYFLDTMEQHDSSEFIILLMEWMEDEIRSKENYKDPDLSPLRHISSPNDKRYLLSQKQNSSYVCSRKRTDIRRSPVKDEFGFGKALLKDLDSSIYSDVVRESKLLGSHFLTHPFAGVLRSRVICSKCQYQSDTFSNFLHVSLPPLMPTLESCFGAFVEEEKVEYNCEPCQKKRAEKESTNNNKNGAGQETKEVTTKKILIAHHPQILSIQFQRLVQVSPYGPARKLDNKVKFGTEFNITPYLLSSFEDGDKMRVHADKVNYDLRAIIVHLGGASSGHFL